MPSAMDVARYFLSLVDEESGDSISNLKLQKLLYYAQGFHLAAYEYELFPEGIKAWAHGPVVPAVYYHCKDFGAAPVKLEGDVPRDQFDAKAAELLNEVFEVYGQYSATSLRNMTHREPPWMQTPQGEAISNDLLSEFFKTRLVVQNQAS